MPICSPATQIAFCVMSLALEHCAEVDEEKRELGES